MFLQSRRLSIDLSTLDICFWTRGRGYWVICPYISQSPYPFRDPAEDPCVWNGSWRENLDPAARLPASERGLPRWTGFFRVPKYETSPRKGVGFYRWSEFIVRKTIWLQHDMDIMYLICTHFYTSNILFSSYLFWQSLSPFILSKLGW